MHRKYDEIKARVPDTVLLFLMDQPRHVRLDPPRRAYQTFKEDAETCRRVLGADVIPFDGADAAFGRLIAAGHKLAICEHIPSRLNVTEEP